MPRPAASDAFSAVSEPYRRRILDLLVSGERSVGNIASTLGMEQPQTSKHLRVLLAAGLVGVRGVGKRRLYRLNGQALRPIHDWVKGYEQLWGERFDRLEQYLKQEQDKGERNI